ncbi:Protein still life, isoform SIF type 1 [Amphibalanus amphitrite]|uniref:Protein still life, isoform SIF type 1 n=1 Tax=Amphibalanus amphitrite TaxID=1232801 RepID=A0A6A4VW43_AMPAM|nr:Protein still life, isoform SIF type 1 [Amphibalanus amphitrite]
MGNSFIRKNYEESPWLVTRRTGNLLRLWAEVFHVSSTGSGTVKWQQISDDLVPVSLTCIQDSPSYVFHITAYNSQVDKILDVRLTQPGTRIGQASECFVYWKDPATGDTWGLNFTSPMDARQFREVCSPSFKFSRKTSSSYSLKLDGKKQKGNKRKPLSTPSSPSGGGREPQCTCMTAEQYARLRAQDPRFRVSALTPPCPVCSDLLSVRSSALSGGQAPLDSAPEQLTNGERQSVSPYDNVAYPFVTAPVCGVAPSVTTPFCRAAGSSTLPRMQPMGSGRSTPAGGAAPASACETVHATNMSSQYKTMRGRCHPALLERPASAQPGQPTSCSATAFERADTKTGSLRAKSNGQLAGSTRGRGRGRARADFGGVSAKSVDFSEMDTIREGDLGRQIKSKSSDNVMERAAAECGSARRPLAPRAPPPDSPVTSPDIPRRHGPQSAPAGGLPRHDGYMSEPETHRRRPRFLDIQEDSPASDNYRFDNHCYATTPSSSNSELDQNVETEPNSPTYTRLLLEYERHLRNTLAKGDDAESYSLHTFEALLSQSTEDLGRCPVVHRGPE